MEWLDILKDVVVVAVIPITYWLKLLIGKQEELVNKMASVASQVSGIEVMIRAFEKDVNKSVVTLAREHDEQTLEMLKATRELGVIHEQIGNLSRMLLKS